MRDAPGNLFRERRSFSLPALSLPSYMRPLSSAAPASMLRCRNALPALKLYVRPITYERLHQVYLQRRLRTNPSPFASMRWGLSVKFATLHVSVKRSPKRFLMAAWARCIGLTATLPNSTRPWYE